MATVVNARDTQILAANPRYLGINMNPNVVVNQSNVNGLGLVVDGTKQIWLAASTQVFQIPKSGPIAPANVTLTANVRNLTATPTISIVAGTMSVTPALTGGVFTYTPDQQTSDILTLRLTLTQDGKTYTDDMTVVKVREGSDALTGLLTNENFSLPADYLGNVTSYSGCGGNFKVYQGATDVTSVCTFAIISGGNPDALTVSLTGSGAGAGAYSITGGYPVAKDITTLTIRATFGTTTIDKVMSIAKAKAGVNGATAKQLVMTATGQAFTFNGDGTATPATQVLTFAANMQNLSGSPVFTATGYNASGTSLGAITLSGTGSTRTMDLTAFGAAQYATVSVTWDGLTDNTSVVRLKDGATNVIGYLTNEAYTVATANDGSGGTYTTAGGTMKVFDGLVDKTGDAAVTYSIPASSGVTISIAANGVYTVTGTTADQGSATIRAVYKGITIDKAYTIARSKTGQAGTNGVNATAYWLARSVAAIQKSQAGVYTPASVTFTGYSATGAGAPAAYAGRFIIATTTDGTAYTDQYTSAANESSKTYTVPAGIKAMRVRLYLAGGTTTLLDEEIVPVVVDGVQGVDGAGGVSAVLSNAAHVLPAAADGTVTSYVGSGTTLRVYEGGTELNYDGVGTANSSWTVSSVATNVTRGTLTDSGTYATIGDSSGVAAGTDTASIVYTVSGKNSKGTAFSFDIKQSISKSKSGANGSNGSNGTNGQRGSRSFYVAIAGSAWVDATATTAASADGGPVLNDIVCEYNNAANFSQTKFWNGSSWIVINAVVDGNLLVSGTVGAKALTINNGGGNNLWFDPNYSDTAAWQVSNWGVFPTQAVITDGASGGTSLRSPTGGSASARGAWRVPVTVGKTYRVSVKARKTPTANGALYVRIDGASTRSGAYGEIPIGIEGVGGMSTTSAWSEFASSWVATQPFASVMVLVNYTGTAGYMEAQDIRLEEMTDSALIVSGGITADRIDSRGLSIKDAAGNIILAAGNALDWSMVAGTGRPADNATVGADWSTNITGIPYASILTNDDSVALGFNPTFDWPVGQVRPTNWGAWSGANPIRETSIVRIGTTAVKFVNTGTDQGIVYGVDLGTAPLPAGTFLTGSIDIYLQAYTSGTCGILVRLFTNAAQTTFTDNKVYIPSTSTGAWQRVPWTARNGTSPVYGIQIFVMAGWTGLGTCLTGTVIFSNLRFMLADNSIDNKTVTIGANGQLNGGGGGTVTITGLGYAGDLNATYGATIGSNLGGQFNSGNISTFFASAAIGLAQINTASIGSLSALSATIGTLRTATSGGRTEIMDNKIYVYDTSNALRIKIGYLL